MTLVLRALPMRRSRWRIALSWLLFVAVLGKAWDSAFLHAIRRLNDTLAAADGRGSRVVLLGVVLLALSRVVLVVACLYVLLSFAIAVAMYSAVYMPPWPFVGLWRVPALAGPHAWYYPFHPQHLAVHAVVLGCALLLGLFQVVLYVRDEDVDDAPSLRSKAARVLMGLAAITIVAYVLFMFLQIYRTMD